MKFNFTGFKAVLFWLAIVGIVGNQLLFASDAISEINEHNELVRQVQESENDKSGKKGFGDILARLGEETILARDGREIWEPDYLKLANPITPYRQIDSWGTFNHILAWGGIVAAVAWLILRFAFVSEVEAQPGRPASPTGLKLFYEPLLEEPFVEKILIEPVTGRTVSVKKVSGVFNTLRNMRFWPVAMFTVGQQALGAFGVLLWILIIMSVSQTTKGGSADPIGYVAMLYVAMGVFTALNKHKFALYSYRRKGWTESA